MSQRVDQDLVERGRANNARGVEFEARVAECYRVLNYRVEARRLFGGREVDLFLTRVLGDLTIHRAIECKAGPVTVEQLDSFLAKLNLVRREYPASLGTIVSGSSFTAAVASHAAASGVQLIGYRDLSAQIFDGHPYVNQLIQEQNGNERYRAERFVEPHISYDTKSAGLPAFRVIDEWLKDEATRQLTLLGDVGTGKTFLSRMIALKLGRDFLAAPLENPLPLLVDLRNADRQFSLEGLMSWHFSQTGLETVTFRVFQHALSEGRIVLVFDGFDEMAAKVNDQITTRNFHELIRCVQRRAKVLLTCRTHYFRSRAEEESVIMGKVGDDESDIAQGLYWDLVTRRGFQIAYIRPFELSQVEDFVSKIDPSTAKRTIDKIKSTYNLTELSQRPMLLDMMVEAIDRLGSTEVNAAGLYDVFTRKWIERDGWRGGLSAREKLDFLTALALRLWGEDASVLHYSKLVTYVQEHFGARLNNPSEMAEIDAEVRTATFLVRDESGHYGFAHKSYNEFFIARYLARSLAQAIEGALTLQRLSPETVRFFCDLVGQDERQISPRLEAVLVATYRPQASENALLLLYALKLRCTQQSDGDVLRVDLPSRMQLDGANLSGFVLEGASFIKAKLNGADLHNAMLKGGLFAGAELSGANCSGANFNDANLEDAELGNARFEGCTFERTSGAPQLKRTHDVPSVEPRFELIYNAVRQRAKWLGFAQGMDPDELASLVWLRLIETRSRGHLKLNEMDEVQLHAFIRGIMLDMIRRQNIESIGKISLDSVSEEELVAPFSDPSLKSDLQALLERLLRVLDPHTGKVINLYVVHDMSIVEIASQLNVSASTVKRRLQAGLARARELWRMEKINPT